MKIEKETHAILFAFLKHTIFKKKFQKPEYKIRIVGLLQ